MEKQDTKALFLDRDGVINIDKGYVHRIEDFEFIEEIFELCLKAKENGYLIIIVTNQSGIGRGYYTEEDFNVLMDWVKLRFQERGVSIDAIYYCPYHAEHGVGYYKQESFDRKPEPGMILKAQKEFDINLSLSLMVGDKPKDMQAASAAGITRKFLYSDDKDIAEEKITSLSEIYPFF